MYNKQIFEEFMKIRFPHEKKGYSCYYEEWRGRFMGGRPETYMDSKSLGIYEDVKEEYRLLGGFKNTATTGRF